MRVEFSPQAREDLIRIARDLSEHDPDFARRTVGEIVARTGSLDRNPERGTILRRYRSARRLISGQYLIIYRVTADSIGILRILHGARDIDAILDGDEQFGADEPSGT